MIRIGVVGYGYWGPNVVRNFAETPGCQLVAVSDMRPERLAQVRSRYPAVRTFADPNEMVADRRIDAVVIVTPVSTAMSGGYLSFETKRRAAIWC